VGVAVLRRATAHAVGDADLLAEDARLGQCVVQHVARTTDERFTLFVLVLAGGLADEQQGGVVGADAVDDAAPRLDECRTAFTVRDTESVHRVHVG
jgi:hypothetical protein